MPELKVGDKRVQVPATSNLLDALLSAGIAVPNSCRAGSCHACLVRCLQGEPADAQPDALTAGQRQQGWRLACQCRVVEDLCVQVFDPLRDGRAASIVGCDWLNPEVLRLRLQPERRLPYQAGQHLVLWADCAVARPYSLASLPEADGWLEFHLDCAKPGAFSSAARSFQCGQTLRLGELRGGALHYDSAWQARALWLMAAGTGLAPLWGILREALRQEHAGPIRLLHLANEPAGHYLASDLLALAVQYPQLQVSVVTAAELPAALAELRLVSRQTQALLCASPASVETFARRLYLLGLPRNQVLADVFLPRA